MQKQAKIPSKQQLRSHAARPQSKDDVVSVAIIPRSREVGQSYMTSVGTTLYSLLFAAWTVLKHKPQLVSGLRAHCHPGCNAHPDLPETVDSPKSSHGNGDPDMWATCKL